MLTRAVLTGVALLTLVASSDASAPAARTSLGRALPAGRPQPAAQTPAVGPTRISARTGVSTPSPTGFDRGRPVLYAPPVTPVDVVRGFDPPASRYAAGHRGVDLAAVQGVPVLAAADGVVTFAGSVAGRGVVVITHRSGLRTEYEPLAISVRVGSRVQRGDPIGTVHGVHAGCARSCLHWGARQAARYVDPMTLLRPLGAVRLLPWTS